MLSINPSKVLTSWCLLLRYFFLANGLRAYALRLDLGHQESIRYILIGLILATLAYAYVALFQQNMLLRTAIMSSVSAVLFSIIAFSAYKIGRQEQSKNAYFIAGVYALVVMAMSFRIISIALEQRGMNLFANDWPQMLLVFSILLSVVVGHFSFIGLMFERNKKKEIAYLLDKARHEESELLKQKIMQLDRQRSLGMVGLSFSHELNQPLNGVFLSAEVALHGLQQQKLTPTQHQELLQRMLVNIQHAKQVLQRLSGLMGTASSVFSSVNLNKVIENTLHLLDPLIQQNSIQIKLNINQTDCRVNGDDVAITQALLNVLRNALEAVIGQSNPLVELSVLSVGEQLMLKVEDSGKGFSPEILALVGQAVSTTKLDGLGVGLCITQQIMEQHKGSMIYMNCNGKTGASVTMILPNAAVNYPFLNNQIDKI